MALTTEKIFQAADQLVVDGVTPTLAAVRTALGGGSYTTISEALKEWKAKQQAAAKPLREPAPESISKRLDEIGAEVWAVALELANARLNSEREALETTRKQLEAGQQEATELADQLSTELEALQARYDQMSESLHSANANLENLHKENATLSRQLATTEARAEETTKRADDLKAELQHAHVTNTEQRQRYDDELKRSQANLAKTNDSLKSKTAETTHLQAQLDQAQAQLVKQEQQQAQQQEQYQTEIQQLRENLKQAQVEKEQALQTTSTARETAATLKGELETLRTQNAALLANITPATQAKEHQNKKPRARKGSSE